MKQKEKYLGKIHIFIFVDELFDRKTNELFSTIELFVFYCKTSTSFESVF